MKPTLLLLAGCAIGASLVGQSTADVSLTDLDSRVAQLETTVGCLNRVAPVAIAQLHGTTKRALVVTNEGPQTFAHPGRFVWLVTMSPTCAKDVTR